MPLLKRYGRPPETEYKNHYGVFYYTGSATEFRFFPETTLNNGLTLQLQYSSNGFIYEDTSISGNVSVGVYRPVISGLSEFVVGNWFRFKVGSSAPFTYTRPFQLLGTPVESIITGTTQINGNMSLSAGDVVQYLLYGGSGSAGISVGGGSGAICIGSFSHSDASSIFYNTGNPNPGDRIVGFGISTAYELTNFVRATWGDTGSAGGAGGTAANGGVFPTPEISTVGEAASGTTGGGSGFNRGGNAPNGPAVNTYGSMVLTRFST